MQGTRTLYSKASRLPITSKAGNKDFYKGTGAARLPGGHRTGAPGRHTVRHGGNYRLIDEKVRHFVAPPLDNIIKSELRPYVHIAISPNTLSEVHPHLSPTGFGPAVYAKLQSSRG